MSKALEFILRYIFCLAGVILGMWVGNLIIGEEVIPITCLIPFVLAFVLAFILSVLHHMSDRKER
ncbi:hypothetical protein MRS_003 [Staphylococcus phage MR003]|nr:nuclease [Staphylococcus phage SAC]BBI90120.1 hypothetical protein MRS_003 [Staphylococcus phage MR003]